MAGRHSGRQGTMRTVVRLVALAWSLAAPPTMADDWRGYVAGEARGFFDDPAFEGQLEDFQGSFVVEPELYREWADGSQSFTFKPFGRWDSEDSERTHLDLRELHWEIASRDWELRVGVSKVFWGVTESQHLVDIVNQTDLVENPDGEDKLGQPMIKFSLIRSWGILDMFLLPGFRERTFPGESGRLRPGVLIDTDNPLYESSAEDSRLDAAIRWSHVLGPVDLGISHFSGTSREPRFVPGGALLEQPRLVPLYEVIDQTGLDFQATLGSWLWKLEAINRSGQGDRFAASTAGFEYSLFGLFDSSVDLGLVGEYLWDERGKTRLSPFEDDVFVGARLALNDVQSTEVLTGAILDVETQATYFLVEASRRLGKSWTLEAEIRTFSGLEPTDPGISFASDDYAQISVQKHF